MLVLVVVFAAGLLLGGGGLAAGLFYRGEVRGIEAEVDRLTHGPVPADDSGDTDAAAVADGEGAGHGVELSPPDVRKGILGLLSQWRHRAKAVKMAEKGYVEWYKLGATVSQPKWVKPDFRGRGEGEYYDSDDDITYLFPKDAMLPDSTTGAWVAMHRENEADPLNLRDPVMTAVPADRLQEIIDLFAEAEKPGFFDRLDISGAQAFIVITVVLFLVYAGVTVMG